MGVGNISLWNGKLRPDSQLGDNHYTPGTVNLSAHGCHHLWSSQQPCEVGTLAISFDGYGNQDTERLSNLSLVTQLVRGQNQVTNPSLMLGTMFLTTTLGCVPEVEE